MSVLVVILRKLKAPRLTSHTLLLLMPSVLKERHKRAQMHRHSKENAVNYSLAFIKQTRRSFRFFPGRMGSAGWVVMEEQSHQNAHDNTNRLTKAASTTHLHSA